jgi:hypothetical protein
MLILLVKNAWIAAHRRRLQVFWRSAMTKPTLIMIIHYAAEGIIQ